MRDAPQWEAVEQIEAPLRAVWDIVDDLSLIPDYHPSIRNVQLLSGEARRRPGVRYRCEAVAGRGQEWFEEKVIEHEPFERTVSLLVADSRGLARRLRGYRCEIRLIPRGDATEVIFRGWYGTGGPAGMLFNSLYLRSAAARRARGILEGIGRLAERRVSAGARAEIGRQRLPGSGRR